MRELIIDRLVSYLGDNDPDGFGLPRTLNSGVDDTVHSREDLEAMSDEELLMAFEATIVFQG